MKSVEREKMCISCEGRIPFSADVCPYCAAHQGQQPAQNSFQAPIFQNQSLEDSLTSLYTPPYQGKRPRFDAPIEEEPVPTTPTMDYQQEMPLYKSVTEKPRLDPLMGATTHEEEAPQRSSFVPTALLLGGAYFAVIGLMQLFFSKNGVLRLEWNANYWFFYFLVSAPLFYFGAKKIKHLEE